MKSLGRLFLIATAVVLSSCASPLGSTRANVNATQDFAFRSFSNLGYMGGEALYVPEEKSNGQLQDGVRIAVRIGKLKQNDIDETQCYFTDVPSETIWSVLRVNYVDTGGLLVEYINYDSDGEKIATGSSLISSGTRFDISGDGVPDLQYAPASLSRQGYEGAFALSFLSSKILKNTTMYALLPTDYATGDYPNGVFGINPNGRFLVKPLGTLSGARAIVGHGVVPGDYVVDITKGSYREVLSVDLTTSGERTAVEIDTNSTFDEAKFLEVFPLVALNISGTTTGNASPLSEDSTRSVLPRAMDTQFDQERYNSYRAQSDQIKKEFRDNHFVLPLSYSSDDKHFPDNIQKLIPINMNLKLEKFSVNLGIGGTLLGVWGHLESSIEVVALAEIDNLTWDVGAEVTFDLAGPRAPATIPVFTFGPVYLDVGGYFQPGLKWKLSGTGTAPNHVGQCVTFAFGVGAKAWIDYGVDWENLWFISIPHPYARPGATSWKVDKFAAYADNSNKVPSSLTVRSDLIPYLDCGLTSSLSGILRADIGLNRSMDAWLTLGNSNYVGLDYSYGYFAKVGVGIDVPFLGRVGTEQRWNWDQGTEKIWSMKLF